MAGFIALLLALLAAGYYLIRIARPPRLVYQDNADNRRTIAALPALTRRYFPTPWLANTHLQLLCLGVKKVLAPRLRYDHSDTLIMADGGTTGLDWLGSELPADTPTLLVLHTITGSPHSMRGLVRDLQRLTGWRVVVCTRRGHGDLPLTAPRINTLGDTADLREQLALIQHRYPHSPLYAVGISAGSGLLVRYLGEEGEHSPIRGAMAYCPGYNVEAAFGRARQPYNRMMTRKLARTFVTANAQLFANLQTYAPCTQARDLHAFHQQIHEMAGYASYGDYLQACNPVTVMDKIRIPMLILNAADDPLCVIENVHEYEELIRNLPKAVLAVTERGSHCAYYSGWRPRSWAHPLIADFFLHTERQSEKPA